MSENIFGENIRKLRYIHNETQKELADKIKVAHTYISMLERGKRDLPSGDIVMAIARHFRVTPESLYRPIESDGRTIRDIKMTWDKLSVFVPIMFPIYKSDVALEDERFKIAVTLHEKIMSRVKNGRDFDMEKIVAVKDGYEESWAKNKTIESLANALSVLCMRCSFFVPQDAADIEEYAKKYGVITNSQFKRVYLRKNTAEDPVEESKRGFTKDNQALIDECFETLKRDTKWTDVADFFLSLSYIVGMVDNDHGLDLNHSIGIEMMRRFAAMGNPMAMDYLVNIYTF